MGKTYKDSSHKKDLDEQITSTAAFRNARRSGREAEKVSARAACLPSAESEDMPNHKERRMDLRRLERELKKEEKAKAKDEKVQKQLERRAAHDNELEQFGKLKGRPDIVTLYKVEERLKEARANKQNYINGETSKSVRINYDISGNDGRLNNEEGDCARDIDEAIEVLRSSKKKVDFEEEEAAALTKKDRRRFHSRKERTQARNNAGARRGC